MQVRLKPTLIFLTGLSLIFSGLAFIGTGLISAQQTQPFTDDACLNCHTDQNRLMELAPKQEEVAESLSSGPG